MARTIILKGNGIRKEAEAAGAITPGHLVGRDATGKAEAHGTALLANPAAFAVENELFGNGIDVDYAATDQVLWEVMPPGSEINALVAANAAAVIIGTELESAGDGTLRIKSTGVVIAISLEALDNSAVGTPARLIVETL